MVRAAAKNYSDVTVITNPEQYEELIKELNSKKSKTSLKFRQKWTPDAIERVIVPVGGRGKHDALRARLLGSLGRQSAGRVHRFVRVMPPGTAPEVLAQAERELEVFASEETPHHPEAQVIEADDVVEALAAMAQPNDLLVLGLHQHRGRRLFGEVALRLARRTDAAVLMISHRA